MDTKPANPPPIIPAPDAHLHCPACGYNLTGLTSDKCPECGQLVTIAKAPGGIWPSTSLSLAIVGCRLLALYFLYSWVMGVLSWLIALIEVIRTLSRHPSIPFEAFRMLVMAGWLVSLIMFLILWFGAPWLARRIVPQSHAPAHTIPTDGRMLLTAGCVAVGLVVFARGLDGLLLVAARPEVRGHFVSQNEYFGPEPPILAAAIEIVLGLWLIFGSGALVRAIIYLRGLGPTAEEKK